MAGRRPRGNPNFASGPQAHDVGEATRFCPPLVPGESTVLISGRLPQSLKAKFDEIPGTVSEKIRLAIELLIEHHQEQDN
jgi:hypothetical protein